MRFPIKFTVFISALMIAGSTSALPARFSNCPSINVIKSEGISMAEELYENIFVAFQVSQYNSDTSWAFVMLPIESSTNEEALDTANDLLDTMSAEGIPAEEEGMIYCSYDTGSDILAAAVEADTMPSVSKMRQLIRKKG